MRLLILAVLSLGALSCSDDPPAKPDIATRAQTTSATSTLRSSSSSYRFAKRPVVVYTAVPPRKPDSFDYEVAFRINRAIPVGKRGIRGEVLLEEQPNLIKLTRVSTRNNCYTATFSSSEGSAAALIRPVEGQRLRVVLRVKGETADQAEVIATRGSYSLVNNERRQHARYRRLGCYR
ncbi:MAG: hypothetical protein H0U51_10400 [Propionibacteriales bacterium]|nr:hypothetical protein [Propionibacteriales bacterium]